jgi:hypothetical protein
LELGNWEIEKSCATNSGEDVAQLTRATRIKEGLIKYQPLIYHSYVKNNC